jgi:hypothetical protein
MCEVHKTKEGVMITVEYPPGGADPIHRHNANVFVYVLADWSSKEDFACMHDNCNFSDAHSLRVRLQ